MDRQKIKQEKKYRRHKKVRAKIQGTEKRPRLNVFRSNTSMYVQLIDDAVGKTLVAGHSKEIKLKSKKTKTEISFELGKLIAKKTLDKKIKNIVFDRGGYKYHGRVKAVADGAREGGLEF